MVNAKIQEGIEIYTESLPIEKARKIPNVKMFFGDKYADVVRVVFIDERFSVEFCGGTHVKNSRDVGLFKIVSESSIASGVRRIEAVTGEGITRYIEDRMNRIGVLDEQLVRLIEERQSLETKLKKFKGHEETLQQARPTLGAISHDSIPPMPTKVEPSLEAVDEVEESLRQREQFVEQMSGLTQQLRKVLSKYRLHEVQSQIDALVSSAPALNGFRVVSAKIDAANLEELKSLGDALRNKLVSGVGVLAAVVSLVCVVTDDLVEKGNLQAGKIVSELAKRVGGGGGGRPHLATAGGKDVKKLDAALKNTVSIVKIFLQRGRSGTKTRQRTHRSRRKKG